MQHRPVRDTPGHAAHQFRVGNAVEVSAQVRVNDLPMSGAQQFVDMPHGIQRAAVGTIGILLRLQVGLEDCSQDQHRRHLHDTILDRRDAQRSLLPVRFGDIHPPNGCRLIRPAFQLLRQFA